MRELKPEKSARYVVGFLFNQEADRVLLIQKQRPMWQKGRWNGIGGHIEDGEDTITTMRREFLEEAGAYVHDWREFIRLTGPGGTLFEITFFYAYGALWTARSVTDEPVHVFMVRNILLGHENTIGNVPWLLQMAKAIMEGKDNAKGFDIQERQ